MMKLWASGAAIGFSVVGLLQACSSPPTDGYTPPPTGTGNSTSQGGSGNSTAQGGTGNSTAGSSSAQGGSGNSTAQGGSTPITGTAGTGTAGGSAGGTSSGAEGPCPAGVVGHCDAGATAASYPTYPGVTLALVEDFPAPIDLDNDPIFTWSDGTPANGQTRFRKEQITFTNGKMVITAQNPPGCPVSTGNPNGNGATAACIPPGISKTTLALPTKTTLTPINYFARNSWRIVVNK